MKVILQTEAEVIEKFDKLTSEKKWAIDLFPNADGSFTLQWIERKTYVAQDGKTFPDEIWITAENEMINVQDLEPAHALNILRLLLRNERKRMELIQAVQLSMMESQSSPDGNDASIWNLPEGVKPTIH